MSGYRLAALLGAVVVTLSAATSNAQSFGRAECENALPIRVQIGTEVYALPRIVSANLFDHHGDYVDRKTCQRESDPALKLMSFSIHLDTNLVTQEENPPPRPSILQIFVRDSKASHRTAAEAYEALLQRMKAEGTSIEDLPVKFGFLVYEPLPNQGTYISTPDTVQRLEPAPLTINCSRSFPDLGRTCDSGYNRYSDSTVVRYRFYDGPSPIQRWQEIDYAVRKFVSSLRSSDTTYKIE